MLLPSVHSFQNSKLGRMNLSAYGCFAQSLVSEANKFGGPEMNRRGFGKLLVGGATTTGFARIHPVEVNPSPATRPDLASMSPSSISAKSVVPASGGSYSWELAILDSAPPHATEVDEIRGSTSIS